MDILLVKKNHIKGYYEHSNKLFQIARESPIEIDLNFIEEDVLLNDEYLESMMKNQEDVYFYINVFKQGLLFDGNRFSKKVEENPFFKDCIYRMENIFSTTKNNINEIS